MDSGHNGAHLSPPLPRWGLFVAVAPVPGRRRGEKNVRKWSSGCGELSFHGLVCGDLSSWSWMFLTLTKWDVMSDLLELFQMSVVCC